MLTWRKETVRARERKTVFYFVVELVVDLRRLNGDVDLRDFARDDVRLKDGVRLLEDDADERVAHQALAFDALPVGFGRRDDRCHVEHDLVMLIFGMIGVLAVLIVLDVEIAAIPREALQLNVIGDELEEFEQFGRKGIVAEDLVFARLIGPLVEKADFEVLPFVVRFVEEKNLLIGLRPTNEWKESWRVPVDLTYSLSDRRRFCTSERLTDGVD